MQSVVFALVCALMIYICYHISHEMINVVSVLVVPYMLIIPINNLFMVHSGFFLISDQVISLIGWTIICIFIGYITTNLLITVHKRQDISREGLIESKFSLYKMQSMLMYILCIEAIALLRLAYVVSIHGVFYVSTSEFEGYMLSGPVGHLILTIYPLIPIIFLYWLKDKRQIIYLIATILCIILLFSTFVKYHVIGMVVLIYLFVSLEDRKYLRKGLVIVSTISIGAFVLNYLISFILRDSASYIAQEYYFNHLWNYMSGSLIYDNRIFTSGVRIDTSILYKIGTVLFAVPNVFLSAIFDMRICPHIALPHLPVGTNGQNGNVVDSFGYFFPSKGNLIEIIFYFALVIFLGVVITVIYNISISRKNNFKITTCVFMTFFVFFSFFGTFYINLVPWEILVWSIIMPAIFDKRKKIVFGRKKWRLNDK